MALAAAGGSPLRQSMPSTLARSRSRLLAAAALVAISGLGSATGALFIVHLYRTVIPGKSLVALGLSFAIVSGLLLLQAGLRLWAGAMADRVSVDIAAALHAEQGEQAVASAFPLLRALRSRAFLSAADLLWVPLFMLVVGLLHPAFGAAGLALVAALFVFARPETSLRTAPPDASWRRRERQRRIGLVTFRDLSQVSILALGASLAIHGSIQLGEMVAATMLTLRALSAVQAGIEDSPLIIAARQTWCDLAVVSKD